MEICILGVYFVISYVGNLYFKIVLLFFVWFRENFCKLFLISRFRYGCWRLNLNRVFYINNSEY